MRQEMCLAHEKVVAIIAEGGDNWDPLYARSDFWVAHSKYLAVEIYVSSAKPESHSDLLRSWTGYSESQVLYYYYYLY